MSSKKLFCKGLRKVLAVLSFSSVKELTSASNLAEICGDRHPLWPHRTEPIDLYLRMRVLFSLSVRCG